jgi:hypothetical protein
MSGLVQRGTSEMAALSMVQQSPLCGKASDDANTHLQHFLEICSTFTIRGVTQDVVHLRLFPFSLLGKAKQWFYSNKEAVSTWEKFSNAFLAMFFPLGKSNPSRTRTLHFSNSWMRPSLRHGNVCKIISLHARIMPWRSGSTSKGSIMGGIRSAREHIDATTGGSFFTLSIEEACKLVEKMSSNQSWDEEHT